MKAKRWPNGLGWDVGQAEVRNMVKHLRVFVPIEPEYCGISLRTHRPVYRDRHKRLDVPLGTGPVIAVEQCKDIGIVHYD